MTLVLLEKGLVLEGSTPKIEDKQVPGIYSKLTPHDPSVTFEHRNFPRRLRPFPQSPNRRSRQVSLNRHVGWVERISQPFPSTQAPRNRQALCE